jgi:ABC-2 type transport system ATP-binding protein
MVKVIDINGLTKKYAKTTALDNLTLSVNEGQIIGYLGPNGAGKTTTIKLLLGLIRPTSGQATIVGLDVQKDKVEVHKHLAFVPSEPAYWPNLTGREMLYMLSKLHGNYSKDYQAKLIRLFDFDPDKKIREYSRGNRQKISLIAAFSTKAKLLIMDEPSTGLDPLMEQVFRQLLIEARDNGQTIFLSSHLLEEVESVCDQIAILKAGKLVESGPLSEFKHLAATSIEASFTSKVPSVDHLHGVTKVQVKGHTLTCQITGPVDEILKVLLEYSPTQLYCRPASLEDLFLSVYGS